MKQEITKGLADGAASLAVGGGIATKLGWFEFINANAPALGFIASCIFGAIATVFYIMTYSKSTQADQNKEDLKRHMEDTEVSFGKVDDSLNKMDSGINEILKKLNNRRTDKPIKKPINKG